MPTHLINKLVFKLETYAVLIVGLSWTEIVNGTFQMIALGSAALAAVFGALIKYYQYRSIRNKNKNPD